MAGGGDDVEGFVGADAAGAVFVCDGAQGGAGEEVLVIWVCGDALGGFKGAAGGGRRFGRVCSEAVFLRCKGFGGINGRRGGSRCGRVRVRIQREAGESEWGGQFREERFEG